jgi:pilus assembly protein CpaB
VNVIVVTQRVPRGSAIDESVLGMIPVQRDLFIQGMYTNVNDVKGRLVRFDLDAGIPLTSGMLVDSAEALSSTGSIAALSIPRGMVSVSIPISRLSSVSYAPQPGDHVNVIVTLQMADYDADFQTMLPNTPGLILAPGPINPETGPSAVTVYYKDGGGLAGKTEVDPVLGQTFYVSPTEPQRPRLVSQSLLQDAVVLQVGDFTDEKETVEQDSTELASMQLATPEAGSEGQTPEGNPPLDSQNKEDPAPVVESRPDVISLIVAPQDAVTLNYLLFSGADLTLALRAAGDDSRVQTEAVTLQFLLDQYNIPVPAKLPYGIPNRLTDDKLAPPNLPSEATPTPTP